VFDGAVAQTVTGVIDGVASNSGNIQVSNTTAAVTFKSVISDTDNIILDASSISVFEATVGTNDINAADQANVTINAAVTAAGTITLTNSTDTTVTIGAGQTYGSASSASTDMITAADVVVTNTTGTQDINVYLPSEFQSGHLVLFQDSNGAGISAAELASVVPQDTALIDYAAVDGDAAYSGTTTGETVVITATRKSAAAAAAELGTTAAAADALFNAATALTGGNATVAAALTAALKAGGATATEAAEQVQGSPDGLSAASGALVASTGGAVVAVGSSRMASLRTGNAYASTLGTGFNAGSGSQSNSMWMKPFVSFGLQSERKGIAGYDADTYGIAIGADTRLDAHSVMGLSFSYADTDVDGKGAGRSRTDISSYQITAYGDYTAKDWYVEALVGYAYNNIDSSRTITFANATASGETESNQFMFSVNAGMPIQVESNSYFTPTTGLSFTQVTNQDYTETGAGGLNLRVNAEDITIAKLHVGGRYHANITTNGGRFTPEVRAKLLYDLAGDDGSSSNTFTGGGAAFQVKGLDVVEFATAVGAGIAYTPSFDEGLNLSLNYDAEIKDNFTGHSGNFTLKYAF
jgi:outer membrane autotransporter protein